MTKTYIATLADMNCAESLVATLNKNLPHYQFDLEEDEEDETYEVYTNSKWEDDTQLKMIKLVASVYRDGYSDGWVEGTEFNQE